MSTTTTFTALSTDDQVAELLREQPDREVARVPLCRLLDLGAFAAGVHRASRAGAQLLAEHDETGPARDRHERLFFVVSGSATFTIDGKEVDAPAGTAIVVREPEARRSAVANEAKTTLLGLGGRRGEAFRQPPGEAMREFWPLHEAKDHEGAEAVLREALEVYPGNPLGLYNLACCASLLGRHDEALDLLGRALEAHPDYAAVARADADFDPVRDDKGFQKLVGE